MSDALNWLPQVISVVGQVAGPLVTAKSQRNAGQVAYNTGVAQQGIGEYQAREYEIAGGEQIASSQRAAAEERRAGRIQASRALALAAASGGGTGGTVARIIANIAGDAAYRSSVALYEGESAARKANAAAAASRYEGKVAYEGGKSRQAGFNIAANTSLIRGAGSLFEKYGMGGFQAGKANPLMGDEYIGSSEWTKEIS